MRKNKGYIWSSATSLGSTKMRGKICLSRRCLWLATKCTVVLLVGVVIFEFLMLQFDHAKWAERHINNNHTEEPEPGENNVMFVEMSCLFNQSESTEHVLSVREMCSIESAARMDPEAQVYLLHSCPIQFNSKLLEYSNLHFWKIDMESLVSGTLLEDWDYASVINQSQWSTEHLSDVVKLLLLWKYGGLYMDLSFGVIKSLSILPLDFLVLGKNDTVHSNIMKLQSNGPGNELADNCMRKLLSLELTMAEELYNGDVQLTQCLLEFCKLNELLEVDSETCTIPVYLEHHFFPVQFEKRKMLFKESEKDFIDLKSLNSLTMYFWNEISQVEMVIPESEQAYSVFARDYCPLVYSTVEKYF